MSDLFESAKTIEPCDHCAGTGIDPMTASGVCSCCTEGSVEVLDWIDAEDIQPFGRGIQ